MNTKNYVYVCMFALVCVISLLLAQPLSVKASSDVIEEIEQIVPLDEIKSDDSSSIKGEKNSINEEQKLSPENTTFVQESDNQAPSTESEIKQQILSDESDTENEIIREDISQQPQIVEHRRCTANFIENVKTDETVKKNSFVFHKYLNKFLLNKKFFDKLSSVYNLVTRNSKLKFIGNKLGLFKKNNEKQAISTIDFAPYYFLTPSFLSHYLETFVFQQKITNISELFPYSLTIQNPDIKVEAPKNIVTPQGVTDLLVLMNAPSPQIEVNGESLYAKLVIDIRNNTLYKYDKNGFPLKAYLVATGARGTRTNAGLRIVTYKERFPYSGAPNSKRGQDPYSYGPNIIFLNKVDPVTGRQCCVEQLLHGNGNEYSIGKKVSHGCVRTNNNVMRKELSKEVVRGDYILLINPDIN